MRGILSLLIILIMVIVAVKVYSQPDYPEATWNPADPGNYLSSNRGREDVRWFIIHVAEGSYGGTINWFKNPKARVSAHFVINEAGTHLTQMVRIKDIAWHAGNSLYNRYSVGIEIAGYVGSTIWPDTLYKNLAKLAVWLHENYNVALVWVEDVAPPSPLQSSGIIGHIQVPDPSNPRVGGGRSHHTDPGSTFNWIKFMNYVRELYTSLHGLERLNVTIKIVSLSGSPISGITVRIEGEGESYLLHTDSEGRINLKLNPGEYRVRIEKDGVKYDERRMYVVSDAEVCIALPVESGAASSSTLVLTFLLFLAVFIFAYLITGMLNR